MEFSLLLIFVILLALGFFTRRRYGLLGVGLILGYLISTNMVLTVTQFIESQGIKFESPPLLLVVGVLLVVLPSIILLFIGPSHQKNIHKSAMAFFYALTGTILSYFTIIQNTPALYSEQSPLSFIAMYKPLIIVIIALLALADLFLIHTPKKNKK